MPSRRRSSDGYEREGSPWYATARLWDDGVSDRLDTRRVLAPGIEAALHAPIPEARFGIFRMQPVGAPAAGTIDVAARALLLGPSERGPFARALVSAGDPR